MLDSVDVEGIGRGGFDREVSVAGTGDDRCFGVPGDFAAGLIGYGRLWRLRRMAVVRQQQDPQISRADRRRYVGRGRGDVLNFFDRAA